MTKVDVVVKELSKTLRKDLITSELMLHLSGKDINCTVVNTLRRLSMESIPTYAFDPSMIEISFNDTIYDNDEMREYISQICIPNLDVSVVYLPDRYWKDVDFTDPEYEPYPEEKKKIELIIQSQNDTTSLMNVTTNDVKYVEDMKENPMKFNRKYPSLIVDLRPNQAFRCIARASLAVGERDDRWSAVSNCFFEEEDETQYKLTVRSLGQFSEYDIMIKTCMIMDKRLENLKVTVSNESKKHNLMNEKRISIILDGEDHTIGNVLARTIQDRPEVIYAAYSKPDHHKKSVVIKVTSTKNAVDSIFEAIKHLQILFTTIEKDLRRLGSTKK